MKRYIRSNTGYTDNTSGLSFDFTYVHTYDTSKLSQILDDVFSDFGLTILGVDFRSVDYSSYPEYRDINVSQCGVDFTWIDAYPAEDLISALSEELSAIDVTLIGYDFYSID